MCDGRDDSNKMLIFSVPNIKKYSKYTNILIYMYN